MRILFLFLFLWPGFAVAQISQGTFSSQANDNPFISLKSFHITLRLNSDSSFLWTNGQKTEMGEWKNRRRILDINTDPLVTFEKYKIAENRVLIPFGEGPALIRKREVGMKRYLLLKR